MSARVAQLATDLEAVRATAQPDYASGPEPTLAALTEFVPSDVARARAATPRYSDRPRRKAASRPGRWPRLRFAQVSDSLEPLEATGAVAGDAAEGEASGLTALGEEGADPLDRIVDIDFREMPLSNAVQLLAKTAQVNVVADADVVGTITASLKGVRLRQAFEIILRMNDYGIIERQGIFYIVPLAEAIEQDRVVEMITLTRARATEVMETLNAILVTEADVQQTVVSANETANILILSGPREKVEELLALVAELDVAEPKLPTVTEVIPLNYADPAQMVEMLGILTTEGVGKVVADVRARQVVITDLPIVIEEMRSLVEALDISPKSVSIETMIVDAVLEDSSQTGVDWLLNAVRRQNVLGETVSNLTNLGLATTMPVTQTSVPGSSLIFGILSKDISLSGVIGAEVQARNAHIVANPSVTTIENKTARISIAEEIPYQELVSTQAGGQINTTEFKEVGTVLEVTPTVTHDNHIFVDVLVKQSVTTDLSVTGVPVEDKREVETTLRVSDGQTVVIGGLRKFQTRDVVRKTPFLGDIPVLGLMFKNTFTAEEITELMVFITCHVVKDELPELTPAEQEQHDRLGGTPATPDGQRRLFRHIGKPGEMRDPAWKWRRTK